MKKLLPVIWAIAFFVIGFCSFKAFTVTKKVYHAKKSYESLTPLKGEIDSVTYLEVFNREWTLAAKETALENNVLAWKLKSGNKVFTIYHIPPTIYWKHEVNQKLEKNMVQLLVSVDSTVQPERWQRD